MTNPLPSLTNEERQNALAKANALRAERAAIKRAVKSNVKTFEWALEQEACQGMYVSQLIRSVPNIGMRRCKSIMQELHIPDNRRVRSLTDEKKEQLIWRVG